MLLAKSFTAITFACAHRAQNHGQGAIYIPEIQVLFVQGMKNGSAEGRMHKAEARRIDAPAHLCKRFLLFRLYPLAWRLYPLAWEQYEL